MEWEAPGIVLDVRPFGESDGIATVMTEDHGAHHGLARGAQSRNRALWQTGNLAQIRWSGRVSDQLGSFAAELIHPAAALVLDDALALSMLTSACAVAEGALAERAPQPRVFDGLLHLLARLPLGQEMLANLIRWEAGLLADLGYGLTLDRCAVTGATTDLIWVSPKTGCAVSEAGAGLWKSRLLPLPPLLRVPDPGHPEDWNAEDWHAGLRITGHFLARDVFGVNHKPLPLARQALAERVAKLTEQDL